MLAKTTPRNVNLGSVRFSMFNNQRDIPFILAAGLVAMVMWGSNSAREPALAAGKLPPDVVANADK